LLTGIERSAIVVCGRSGSPWQNDVCVARGKAVQVYFNYETQKSEPLPIAIRAELEKHMMKVPA
jgi:hypothetical protein